MTGSLPQWLLIGRSDIFLLQLRERVGGFCNAIRVTIIVFEGVTVQSRLLRKPLTIPWLGDCFPSRLCRQQSLHLEPFNILLIKAFSSLLPFPQILSIRVYVVYNSRYSYRVAVSPSHNRSIKQLLGEINLIKEEVLGELKQFY